MTPKIGKYFEVECARVKMLPQSKIPELTENERLFLLIMTVDTCKRVDQIKDYKMHPVYLDSTVQPG